MFDATRKEIALRLVEGRVFLSILTRAKPDITHSSAATCRGLLFVQLYGAYEYAVTMSVQSALDTIRTDSLSCSHVRKSVLALILQSRWDSVATSGRRRLWERRMELLATMHEDTLPVDFDNTLFPNDGSHYRVPQLDTIWQLFGIAEPVLPHPRLALRINELVENRNAIAHGRHTAREVGSRYTDNEMAARIDDTDAITQHVIDTIKTHCTAGGLRS